MPIQTNIITKYKKYLVALIVSVSLIFSGILLSMIFKKSVNIKKAITTFKLAENNMSAMSKNITINLFLKPKDYKNNKEYKNDKVLIHAEDGTIGEDNVDTLYKCHITTQEIRGKHYRGPTEIIELDTESNKINIPKKIELYNSKNGQNNFIIFQNVFGSPNKILETNKPFKINDEDLFASGNSMIYDTEHDYIKITGKAYIKQTKPTDTYQIYAKIIEYFKNQSLFVATKNVIVQNKDAILNGEFGKAFLDDKRNITDIYIQDDVHLVQKDGEIFSDYAYFDVEKNLVVFFKNVEMINKKNKTKNEFYIYNTETKNGLSYNEYTPLNIEEKKNVNSILNKLIQQVRKHDAYRIKQVMRQNRINEREREIRLREEMMLVQQKDKQKKKRKIDIIDRTHRVKANIHLDS